MNRSFEFMDDIKERFLTTEIMPNFLGLRERDADTSNFWTGVNPDQSLAAANLNV